MLEYELQLDFSFSIGLIGIKVYFLFHTSKFDFVFLFHELERRIQYYCIIYNNYIE